MLQEQFRYAYKNQVFITNICLRVKIFVVNVVVFNLVFFQFADTYTQITDQILTLQTVACCYTPLGHEPTEAMIHFSVYIITREPVRLTNIF